MTREREGGATDPRGLSKNRIEALADGIFAVAMTLLVLDIKSPVNLWFDTNRALVEHLGTLEHSFAMYAISFVVLGMFWLAHHQQFHYVRYVDRRLLWINLVFLLFTVLVPFSTDLIGDHGHLLLPVFVYGVNLLVLASLLLAHLHHLVGCPDLASPDLADNKVLQMRRQMLMFATIPLVSMATSLFSPRAGMYLYLLLAIPAFVPGTIDRIARAAPTGKRPHDVDPS